MKNKKSYSRKIIILLSLFIGLFAIVQLSSIKDDKYRGQSLSLNQTNHSDQFQSQQIKVPVEVIDKPNIEIVERLVPKEILSFQDHLAIQAELRLQSDVTYDGSYLKIGYPLGDVPAHIGVCTDVVIRSFRGLGVDLQERVHEDMKRNFRSYPTQWNLSKPDSNIDHRRVPNLMTYFERAGASLEITDDPLDYFAGDIVAWSLSDINTNNGADQSNGVNKNKGKDEVKSNALLHIGIVSNYVSEFTSNPLIVHNIGAGPQLNDMLFDFKIIGHYKYGETSVGE